MGYRFEPRDTKESSEGLHGAKEDSELTDPGCSYSPLIGARQPPCFIPSKIAVSY